MAYEGASRLRSEAFSLSRVPSQWRWAWDGLVAAVPGWEGQGGPVDLVAGEVGTLYGGADYIADCQTHQLSLITNSYVLLGDVVSDNGASQYATPLNGSVTIAAIHSPGSTSQTSIWTYAGAASYRAPFALIYSLGGGSLYEFWNDNNGSSANKVTTGSTTFGAGTRNFVVGRRIGDHAASPIGDIFVNGLNLGTNSAMALDSVWDGADYIYRQAINRFGGFNGYMAAGSIGNILVWNRALSNAEIEALSNDPWGPLRQQSTTFLFIGTSAQGGATSRLAPDAIAASTNLTGSVGDIDEDPDSPDANWLTATSATAVTDIRVTFPTPPSTPVGTQNFRYLLRKTTGTPDPTITAELRQNNTLRRTMHSGTAITSDTGVVLQGDWGSGDLLSTLDGSDVELRIVSVVGSTSDPGAMPAYAGVGTLFDSATMPQTDLALNSPTHAIGDLLIALVACRNTNNNGLLSSVNGTGGTSGWTLENNGGSMYGGTQNVRIGFGWKIATATTEVCSITTSGGTSTDRIHARVYKFTATNGFNASAIQDIGTPTTGTLSAGQDMTIPSIIAGGTNELALCLYGISVSSTQGEPAGDWTEPVGEDAGTNCTTGIFTADDSDGSGVLGDTSASGATSGVWVALSMHLVPETVTTNVNTVEIGAIEWNAYYNILTLIDTDADLAAQIGRTATLSSDLAVRLDALNISADAGVAVQTLISQTAAADIAIRDLRVLQAAADSAVQTAAALQTQADAAVAIAGEIQTSADAIVQADRSVEPVADAAVQADRSVEPIADAAVQADRSVEPVADAAVQADRSVEPIADAAVQTGRTTAATADAAVQAAQASTLLADIAIQKSDAAAISADAAVSAVATALAIADIAIQSGKSITSSADLMVDLAAPEEHTAFAQFGLAVQDLRTAVTTASIAVSIAQTATTNANMAILASQAASANADIAILAVVSANASADIAILDLRTIAHTADVAASITQTALTNLDTVVQVTRELSSTLDTVVQSAINIGTGSELAVQKAFVAQAALDAAVQTTGSLISSVNIAVSTSRSLSASADLYAMVEGALQVAAMADIAVTAARDAIAAADIGIAIQPQMTVTLDAVVAIGGALANAADTAVLSTVILSLGADAAVLASRLASSGADTAIAALFSSAALADTIVSASLAAVAAIDIAVSTTRSAGIQSDCVVTGGARLYSVYDLAGQPPLTPTMQGRRSLQVVLRGYQRLRETLRGMLQ